MRQIKRRPAPTPTLGTLWSVTAFWRCTWRSTTRRASYYLFPYVRLQPLPVLHATNGSRRHTAAERVDSARGDQPHPGSQQRRNLITQQPPWPLVWLDMDEAAEGAYAGTNCSLVSQGSAVAQGTQAAHKIHHRPLVGALADAAGTSAGPASALDAHRHL